MGALRAVALPLTLLTTVFLARVLGPEDYGRYAFAVSLGTLLSLPAGQGITQLITREIAHGVEEGRFGVHRGIMGWAWRRLGLYGLFLLLVAGAYWGAIGTEVRLELIVAAVLAPLVAAYQVFGGAIRGHGAPVRSQIPEMLIRPLGVLLVVGLVWMLSFLSLGSALYSHVLATGAGLILSWWLLRRVQPAEVSSASPERDIKAWRPASYSFMLIATAEFMNIEIGIISLGLLGLDEDTSGMRIAQSAAQMVILALIVMDLVIQPRFAVLARQGDVAALCQTYVQAARLAFGASLFVALPLMLFAEDLVRIGFGEAYIALATGPLIILCATQLLNAVFGNSSTLLNMSGLERLTLRVQVVALGVSVPATYLLAGFYGAIGASVAIGLGMLIKKALEAYFVRRHYGVWLHAFARTSGPMPRS